MQDASTCQQCHPLWHFDGCLRKYPTFRRLAGDANQRNREEQRKVVSKDP